MPYNTIDDEEWYGVGNDRVVADERVWNADWDQQMQMDADQQAEKERQDQERIANEVAFSQEMYRSAQMATTPDPDLPLRLYGPLPSRTVTPSPRAAAPTYTAPARAA